MKRISVALCTFNGADYIHEQIESIINQILPVSQIVICDDGSSDSTIEIVKRLAQANPLIEWVINCNIYNLGVIKNFEKAFSLCTGEIIFLCDQDDVWCPEKTVRVLDYFDKNKYCNVVFTDAILINEHNHPINNRRLFEVVGMTQLRDLWEKGMQFEMLNVNDRATGATMACRRDFINSIIPFDTQIGELHDGLLAVEGIKHSCLGVIWEPLTMYRIHSKNVMGLGSERINSIPQRRDLISKIFDPKYGLKDCFSSIQNFDISERVLFYKKRIENYYTFSGKLKLLVSIRDYLKFYKSFGMSVYFSDLTYGFVSYIRNRYNRVVTKK